ncbi:hypothetical protein A2U01_0068647, partial [Trifolium medium]|nr:hypothetical protein [Trifolium medium]
MSSEYSSTSSVCSTARSCVSSETEEETTSMILL